MISQIIVSTIAIICVIGLLIAGVKRRRKKLVRDVLGKEYKVDSMEDAAFSSMDDCIIGKPRVIGKNYQAEELSLSQSVVELIFDKGCIVFYLMAKNGETFSGYELLQTLLDHGLKHNDRGIFDYYQNINGRPEVLFSLASAEQPGSFNLEQMGSHSCSGLSLFMKVEQEHAQDAFIALLKIVQQLSEELGGDIFDISYQPCTQEYLMQCQAVLDKQHQMAVLAE